MTRYDLYERFAGEHLRTRAERVVYFTLVAQTRASWSAAEIAALNALDSPSVAAVLDGYEAAGIVEADESRPGRRYRWRSDMTYLFGDGVGAADLIDPVCGMRVAGDTPYSAVDADARRWTFCSAVCLAVFQATPEPCVPAPTSPNWPAVSTGTSTGARSPGDLHSIFTRAVVVASHLASTLGTEHQEGAGGEGADER